MTYYIIKTEVTVPELTDLIRIIKKNNIKILKATLEREIHNAAEFNNAAIIYASKNGYNESVDLLWNIDYIKTSLQNDNLSLYNILNQKDIIKNNLSEF